MDRRTLLLVALSGSVILTSAGFFLLRGNTNTRHLTMAASIQTLDELIRQELISTGEWNLYQILIHCSQSIEYSMSGFPDHKSDLFKETVGKIALEVFSTRGEMRHNLSEAIPGAPMISAESNTHFAYLRLRKAMISFQQYQGQLAEHFAYGKLDKKAYEIAHAMHFINHLTEVKLVNPL